uniref:NADH-ubiquinone oxidoreductase chain 4L n=1 Tax=Phloeosinus perlatus TaxID=2800998 RepID=A0A891GU87_9CUCU|nr:NADH dehydrogenase subunit 4L [Phloeosinus perlatus]QRK25840.1 NADH dehydrogenase subunit 4L [Phloeosinus perlatus]
MFSWVLSSMFFSGTLVFIFKFKHFLLVLIGLEAMVLSVFSLLFIYFMQFYGEYFFSMVFLSMSVCESSLGLSLLVSLIRSHGSDFLLVLNNLW